MAESVTAPEWMARQDRALDGALGDGRRVLGWGLDLLGFRPGEVGYEETVHEGQAGSGGCVRRLTLRPPPPSAVRRVCLGAELVVAGYELINTALDLALEAVRLSEPAPGGCPMSAEAAARLLARIEEFRASASARAQALLADVRDEMGG